MDICQHQGIDQEKGKIYHKAHRAENESLKSRSHIQKEIHNAYWRYVTLVATRNSDLMSKKKYVMHVGGMSLISSTPWKQTQI